MRRSDEVAHCPLAPLAGPFHDGELSETEAETYLRHLLACPPCRAELKAVRRLSQLLASDVLSNPGDWAPEEVLAVETMVGSRRGHPYRPRPAGGPAALGVPGGGRAE